MIDGQIEVDGLLMGPGTRHAVATPQWTGAAVRDAPSERPRGDGQRWGRGYRAGRSVTIDIITDCYTEADGLDAAAELGATWDAAQVRSVPGAVSVMRFAQAGRVRRVYGRTGKLDPANTGIDWTGWVGHQAEFVTVDQFFYDDASVQTVVPFIPTALGGLVGPQTGGWLATTRGVASGRVAVGGSAPAWLTWTVRGPIVNPTIEVLGRWSATLQMTLAYDQSVTVDPTPWARSVRRNDGASFAGAFTADSARLSRMQVSPGVNEVLLRGTDPTGTSSLTTTVRAAHASA